MTKAQLLQARANKEKTPMMAPIFESLKLFLDDVGLGHLTPKDNVQALKLHLNRIHKMIVLENPVCPSHIDVNLIYTDFMLAVTYGKVVMKDRTIAALVQAFRQWIMMGNTIESLEEKAGVQVIKLSQPVMPDKRRLAQFLEDWPDDEIQRQLSIINMIGFKSIDFPGAGGYMARIFKEASKRGLNPLPVAR